MANNMEPILAKLKFFLAEDTPLPTPTPTPAPSKPKASPQPPTAAKESDDTYMNKVTHIGDQQAVIHAQGPHFFIKDQVRLIGMLKR